MAVSSEATFRSSHLPLNLAYFGNRTAIVPDRALATYNQETNTPEVGGVTTYRRWILTKEYEFNAPGISDYFYGDNGQLDWFICLYNGVLDPTAELIAGRELLIPDYAQTITYLSNAVNPVTAVSGFVAV